MTIENSRELYRVGIVTRKDYPDIQYPVVLLDLGRVDRPRSLRKALLAPLLDNGSVDLTNKFKVYAETVISASPTEDDGINFPGWESFGFKCFGVERSLRARSLRREKSRIIRMYLVERDQCVGLSDQNVA